MSLICNFMESCGSKFESETDGQIRPRYFVFILCVLFFFVHGNSSEQHKNYLVRASKGDTNAISVCARRETEPLAVLRSRDYHRYKPCIL